MLSLVGALRKFAMGVPLVEADFERRGFHRGNPQTRERLERIAKCVVNSYNVALEITDPRELAFRLDLTEPEMRGWAYEGAGMGLAMVDIWTPFSGGRFKRFVETVADKHVYICHIGAGFAHAIFGLRIDRFLTRVDPFLKWLVLDGYGFCYGFFKTADAVGRQLVPPTVTGYAKKQFDAGLGRSLWFVNCADIAHLKACVESFPYERRADLWSGVGLASAYAGGVDRAAIEALRRAAGPHAAHLGVGASLASRARVRAGNMAPQTELACSVLCGVSAEEAENIGEVLLDGIPQDGREAVPGEEAWETWLKLLAQSFEPKREIKVA